MSDPEIVKPYWLRHIAKPLRSLAVPIATLQPDTSNARRHPTKNRAAVLASLQRWGQRLPLVVDGTRVVVGNLRLECMVELGWKACAVVEAPDGEADAFAVADNRTADLAEWDDAKLAEVLATLDADADLLSAVGYTETDLDALFESVGADLADPGLDDLLEAPVDPEPEHVEFEVVEPEDDDTTHTHQVGETVELGDHRIVVADAGLDLQAMLDAYTAPGDTVADLTRSTGIQTLFGAAAAGRRAVVSLTPGQTAKAVARWARDHGEEPKR
jgi:ParB-like chromosome segregation protein Spo0J